MLAALVIAVSSIGGCSSTPPNTVLTTDIPVVVKQKIPERPLPKLKISDITDTTSYDNVVKYYAITVEQLKNEVSWYRSVIYRNSN